jgi:hypothetical protein
MKRKLIYTSIGVLLLLFTATQSQAQDITSSLQGMQPILDNVYNQMIPMCSNLIGAAQGIAGFAALWYIASRVWRQIGFLSAFAPFRFGHGGDAISDGHFADERHYAAHRFGDRRDGDRF